MEAPPSLRILFVVIRGLMHSLRSDLDRRELFSRTPVARDV